MTETSFVNPWFLWLLLLLPFMIVWNYWTKNKQNPTLKMSSTKGFGKSNSVFIKIKPYLYLLRIATLGFLIIALARPRTVNVSSKTKSTKGVDIVMAMDVSGSMLARDFKPNRMEALKKVGESFVINRPNDRIGIVIYASEAYTKTPVTSDKTIILDAIKTIKYDNVLQDGTGIGMGLATSVNRLKDSKAKSKIIILLTDGVNNAGFIEPETAADIAKQMGIKVYTIAIGTNGNALFPYAIGPDGNFLYKMMPVEIDVKLLQNIAQKTGGKYFRATSNQKLESIYDEINKLETSEIKELKFYDYDEKFRLFALLAGLLLLIEIILKQTVYRSFI